jgi:CheY-like chemotaxis protein
MNNTPGQVGRVLLAEDNLVNQKIARKILERMGCEVMSALNGEEAIELWSAETFDLVLMDVQMPRLDGLSATRKLRELEQANGTWTPIVALTANVLPEDIAECRKAGMDAHIPKPFFIEEMQAIVASWLEQKAA